jgi:hypothetical protein
MQNNYPDPCWTIEKMAISMTYIAKASMKAITKLRKLDTNPVIANPLPLFPLATALKAMKAVRSPSSPNP